MSNKFKETQHFNDKIMLTLIGLGIIASAVGLINSLLSSPTSYAKTIAFALLIFSLGFLARWLMRLKLKVSVNEKRIKYKMYPFHKKQKIDWEEVASCKIVKTPLAAQWHGSNVHFSREIFYSLTGRNGLSIQTKSGKTYFIGCKNIEKLKDTLASAG